MAGSLRQSIPAAKPITFRSCRRKSGDSIPWHPFSIRSAGVFSILIHALGVERYPPQPDCDPCVAGTNAKSCNHLWAMHLPPSGNLQSSHLVVEWLSNLGREALVPIEWGWLRGRSQLPLFTITLIATSKKGPLPDDLGVDCFGRAVWFSFTRAK